MELATLPQSIRTSYSREQLREITRVVELSDSKIDIYRGDLKDEWRWCYRWNLRNTVAA